MSIAKINHKEQAKEQVIQQYKESHNFIMYLLAMIDQDDAIEDALYDLLDNRHLEVAEGEQLNALGRIVGISRNILGKTLTDSEYKVYISAKIYKNHTFCTIQELTEVYEYIFGVTCHVEERLGVMILLVGRALTDNEKLIMTTKDNQSRYIFPKVLGIGLEVIQFAPENPFAYQGFPNAKGYNIGKYAGKI